MVLQDSTISTTYSTQLLIQAMVISQLNYCNSLQANLPAYAIQPLQLIQNSVAQLVFNLPKFSHVTPLLWSLHWLPVAARIHLSSDSGLRCSQQDGPSLPTGIIPACTPAPPLRSAVTGRLAHPASRVTYSRSSRLRSFSTLAPQLWNDLPIPIRTAPSLPSGGMTSPSP